MHYTKNLICVLLFVCFKNVAQNNFETLGESAFAVNHKVSKNYSLNFALKDRYYLYKAADFTFEQRQIDIVHFSTFKLNYNHDLSVGLQYRNRDLFSNSSNELRITEQFNYKKQKIGIRYGHRFRAEQRILNTKTIFRQRYRFAIDFPLNGEKLNIGESYLVNTVEGLLSVSKKDRPETDIRISSQIGWQVTEVLKLQTGLEHRFEAFNLKTKNNLFILTTAVLKI